MSPGDFTVTTAYPSQFISGDIIEIHNDYMNIRAEIVSVRQTVLHLHAASWWTLLRNHFWNAWLKFRWFVDDAYLELSDIWDEAKADWRSLR
jgi:hypothetical protein